MLDSIDGASCIRDTISTSNGGTRGSVSLTFAHVGSYGCMIDFGLRSPDDGHEKLHNAVSHEHELRSVLGEARG